MSSKLCEFISHCEASDFRRRPRTDFLHDLRLRHIRSGQKVNPLESFWEHFFPASISFSPFKFFVGGGEQEGGGGVALAINFYWSPDKFPPTLSSQQMDFLSSYFHFSQIL